MKRLCSGVVTMAVLFLAGCVGRGRFSPVQGPLATMPAPPVLTGSFRLHAGLKTFSVSLVMNDGQRAQGTLSLDEPDKKKPAAAPAMMRQWDAVYGQGKYVATVLGQGADWRGFLKSSGGEAVEVELHVDKEEQYGGRRKA